MLWIFDGFKYVPTIILIINLCRYIIFINFRVTSIISLPLFIDYIQANLKHWLQMKKIAIRITIASFHSGSLLDSIYWTESARCVAFYIGLSLSAYNMEVYRIISICMLEYDNNVFSICNQIHAFVVHKVMSYTENQILKLQ